MKSGQRGSTLVEFAFAGLLLFIALFAALEFARWMYLWNSMTEATRRGARVAAVCPINDPAIARVTVFINHFPAPALTAHYSQIWMSVMSLSNTLGKTDRYWVRRLTTILSLFVCRFRTTV